MRSVLIGMSGGVDSSVAAYLLKKEGFDCIGVTLWLWGEPSKDAEIVAKQIGIPHYVLDFRDSFKKEVVDNFLGEYINARTPNPCIVCNRMIKWEKLLSICDEMSADYIATGHYAKIEKLENQRYTVFTADDKTKDQTYVLYRLTQEQLRRTLMPLYKYKKDDIRKIAGELGLDTANKKDSQDICFIPDGDYSAFIKEHLKDTFVSEGDFVDISGNVLGRHKGIINYTVGQRKGLGISLGERTFVLSIDPKENKVVLGKDSDTYKSSLVAGNVNFMSEESFDPDKKYKAKIRYSHEGSECYVKTLENNRIQVDFPNPVRAVTPGQAVVIYDGDYIAGGGTIE